MWSPIKPRKEFFFPEQGGMVEPIIHFSCFFWILTMTLKCTVKRACQSWNSPKLYSFASSKVPFITNSGRVVNPSANIWGTAATLHPSIPPVLLFSHSFAPRQQIFPNRRLRHDSNDNATPCELFSCHIDNFPLYKVISIGVRERFFRVM